MPGLSPSGADPLKLEYRDLDKIKRHFHNKRDDVLETPTTRIFIGYFPRGTKARDVRTELERYGDVTEVMLGGGDDGGDCFCFAQFKRVQDSARAKAAIHGRTMPAVTGARQLCCVQGAPPRLLSAADRWRRLAAAAAAAQIFAFSLCIGLHASPPALVHLV